MRKSALAAAAAGVLACSAANAAIDIYSASLLGVNECAGSAPSFVCGAFGDPDGFGGATVMIDNATNTVSWSILALNIEPPVAAHIHFGAAGTNGPVRIDFNAALSGTVMDDDAAMITPANAMDRYVNVHTASFPAGAIRGQLTYVTTVSLPIPEPTTASLLLAGLAVLAVGARRLRKDCVM